MNMRAQVMFELDFFKAAVQHFSSYAKGNPNPRIFRIK